MPKYEKILNACGTQSNAEIDQVHDPINRDGALRERYAALRAIA